jgi:hypothetical protein
MNSIKPFIVKGARMIPETSQLSFLQLSLLRLEHLFINLHIVRPQRWTSGLDLVLVVVQDPWARLEPGGVWN